MAGEKVRIKIRHDRHGVIYPKGAVVTLPPNLEFSDVLHELLEPAKPKENPKSEPPKGKGKGKVKVETPPAAGEDDEDDSP